MTQDEALTILKTGKNVFLTGEPGSGKTHTVNCYVSYLRERNIEPAVTASTGIAATHIGGMTIHSWSGIGISAELSANDIAEIVGRKHISRRLEETTILIIDEISMLDGKTLSLVDRVCRAGKDSSKPFGGMQVVFVGDFFQLPPVARRGEPPPQFAFVSEAWRATDPVVCYLAEQHRQEDAVFLEVLAALRRRSFGAQHRAHLDRRRVRSEEHAALAVTKLFPHNDNVDRINEAELAKLPGAARVFMMESSGQVPFVKQLKSGCLSPETLTLKVGARVMFTKNNFEARFVNGTMGQVVGFRKEDGVPLVKTRGGATLPAEPMEWTIADGDNILAKIVQVPLRLAWAITVHKSQGMSLDAAFMDLSGSFEYGQGYVALSRVRTLAGLYLAGFNNRALEVHPEVARQDAAFRVLSDQVRDELHAMDANAITQLHENFIRTCGGKVVPQHKGEKGTRLRSTRVASAQHSARKERRWEKTLSLIREGRTIAEVARIRRRSEDTIMQHLEMVRAVGKLPPHDIAHIASGREKEIAEVQSIFRRLGAEKLKPVFEYFGGRYPYDTIRLARLLFVGKGEN